MKKLVLTLISICAAWGAINSQSVKVVYEEKMINDSSLFSSIEVDDPEMLSFVESAVINIAGNYCLYYHGGESLYEELALEKENTSEFQAQDFIINFSTGGKSVYKNQAEKKQISQEYIMDRAFIISETLALPKWEILTEEKKIMNLTCKKAKIKDSEITAWYCPEIPINDGPMSFWGLPGLILEIDMGSVLITAQEIDLKFDTKEKIKIPENGKKITREKYNEIALKKVKEMSNSDAQEGTKVSVTFEYK